MTHVPKTDKVAVGRRNMNLSFAGCGFLGIYHVGVATCFRQYVPDLITEKIAGASAGALAACGLICNVDLGGATTSTLQIALEARSRTLGPIHPTFNLMQRVRYMLAHYLPDNAYAMASGRLFIALTRVSDRKGVLISQFDNNEQLIQALICSCFIPFYCGMIPPKFKGVRYVDGGFSNNIPILDEETITVSPFAGESDICPDDHSASDLHFFIVGTSIQCTMGNFYRMSHAFFPPSPEVLADMCQQGFDDALKYLQRNNLLACTQHLSVMSSIVTPQSWQEQGEAMDESSDDEEEIDFDDDDEDEAHCEECQHQRHVALMESMPQPVLTALQAAIDSVNTGAFAKLYKMRAYKVVSLMAQPWVLPVEISIILVKRLLDWAPYMPSDMQWFTQELLQLLRELYKFIQHSRHRYSARLTCQLAITELDYQKSLSSRPTPPLLRHSVPQPASSHSRRRNLNFGFSVDFKSHTHDSSAAPQQCVNEIRHQLADDPLHDSATHLTAMSPVVEQETDDDEGSHQACRQRAASIGGADHAGYDTFENCLQITNQMDSILTFHYMDEAQPNVIKVKEIYPLDQALDETASASESDDGSCRARSRSFGNRQQFKRGERSLLEEYSGHRWHETDSALRPRETTPKLRCKHKHH